MKRTFKKEVIDMLSKTNKFQSISNRFLMLAVVSFLGVGTSVQYANAADTLSTDNSKTADQQGNDKADIQITQKIRQNIIKDKNLSLDAHNVKIITDKGKVVLKGAVHSEREKAAVEHKAQLVAGAENVQNQLEVIKKD